jgi:hypothetical protein
MGKVRNALELGQGIEMLYAIQMEYCTQNKQMIAMGYILDMEDMVQTS